jgi:choloylglycine hydrolase
MKILSNAAIISLILYMPLSACTGIKLTAEDQSIVHGRTLEFGQPIDLSLALVPRGFSFKGTTPIGAGIRYQAKYAALGVISFGYLSLLDGINEMGLSVGTFYFPGYAGYSKVTKENQKDSLSPIEFPNWVLTQFATIKELKEGLKNIYIAETVQKEWGFLPPPFHYIVFDKSGECIVVEPLSGTLIVYENEIGTLTNSPTFDWHITNLRNYINLSPYNSTPLTLNGFVLGSLGMGSGMHGLPGDFTPPSRFVRAAFFSSLATPAKTASEAIFDVFHILNHFDIPLGSVREKVGEIVFQDKTQVTIARDPESLRYYFKSYDDQRIKFIDLTQFDLNSRFIKTLPLRPFKGAEDVSKELK